MIDKQLQELKKLGSLSNRNSYFYLNLNKELFIDFGTYITFAIIFLCKF